MSNKLERDIEEVLAKIERFPSRQPLRSRVRRRLRRAVDGFGRVLSSFPGPRLKVGQVLLLSMAILVTAYVFRDALGSVVGIVVVGGIILFIGAFVVSLRQQSSSRLPEKRWRGQPMDLDQSQGQGSWWKRWWSRR